MASYTDSATAHNSKFAMQKYLLLHSQHEELLQQLHDLCPSYTYTTSSSTAATSPSLSPTRSFPTSPRNHRRSSGTAAAAALSNMNMGMGMGMHSGFYRGTLEPVLDETLLEEMAAGEQKLWDVNEGIKRALTELLNCDLVRKDRTMRTWVQSRLMETEKELRSGRRRRSSGGSGGLD